MVKVRVREAERELELGGNYELNIYRRRKFVEVQMTGQVVVHEKDLEWEQGRQGRTKWYLNWNRQDWNYPLREWGIFVQDIRKHSGSHKHQGGIVIFCLEGKGYSIVDGVRHDWEAGDLLLLPLKPGGVEHQHFNLESGKPCKWIAFMYHPYNDLYAAEITQMTISPDYNPR